MMTDPVGDMLTRIRNASEVRHAEMRCPASKLKLAVAEVLAKEGFIEGVQVADDSLHPELILQLRYAESGKTIIDGLKRVSTPGRRVYQGASELRPVRNGLGMSIISTSQGVLCDRDARAQKVGGEVLCEVW
ncbi:MAG: 30S ribosomal protein S8 [Myxococcota bacterium]|nr:30S ribosomal protein S8 [Myxococcota bacterium]